jgi:hypothetical protein
VSFAVRGIMFVSRRGCDWCQWRFGGMISQHAQFSQQAASFGKRGHRSAFVGQEPLLGGLNDVCQAIEKGLGVYFDGKKPAEGY